MNQTAPHLIGLRRLGDQAEALRRRLPQRPLVVAGGTWPVLAVGLGIALLVLSLGAPDGPPRALLSSSSVILLAIGARGVRGSPPPQAR